MLCKYFIELTHKIMVTFGEIFRAIGVYFLSVIYGSPEVKHYPVIHIFRVFAVKSVPTDYTAGIHKFNKICNITNSTCLKFKRIYSI